MRDWLSRGILAARVVADRSDLWFSGALVAFAFAGWVVLLLTVANPPGAGGAVVFGLSLTASPWWPWNVVVLVVAIVSGLATLLIAIAFGEVALLHGLADRWSGHLPPSVPRAMGVLATATVPVVIVVVLVGWLVAPAIVDAYTQPDPALAPPLRVLGSTWPALLVVAAAIVVAQAFGATALRQPRRRAVATIRLRGHRLMAVAATTFAVFVIGQAGTAVVLGLLWRPLAGRLAVASGAGELSTAVLLLGFVWIWLVLVILAGVVQAWTSAWWNEELKSATGG